MKTIIIKLLLILFIIAGLVLFSYKFELNYEIKHYEIVNTYDYVLVDSINNKSNIYTIKITNKKPTLINCLKALKNSHESINKLETLSTETLNNYKYINVLLAKKNTFNAHNYVNTLLNNTLDLSETHYYVFNSDNDDILVGDEILKIDEEEINTLQDIENIILKKNENDLVNVLVKRNNEEIKISTKVYLSNEKLTIGISVFELPIDTSSKINYLDSLDEDGYSSIDLAILEYEQLLNEQLIDENIMAIGKVEDDGTLVDIDDFEIVFKTAIDYGITAFIIPTTSKEKYESLKDKYNVDVEFIDSSTIEELLNKYSQITYSSDTIILQTEENTGYEWSCENSNKNIASIKTTNDEEKFEINITGKKKGTTTLVCTYKRDWEETIKDKTITYTITVDKEKNVTYTKD